MKKLRFLLALPALALVSALTVGSALVGCKADSEPTYTVWATTLSNAEFTAAFGLALQDNVYVRQELTSAEWDLYKNYVQDVWKHEWTENEIYVWFLERTFGETSSRQLTTWLISVNHGSIALRRGSLVYAIAK